MSDLQKLVDFVFSQSSLIERKYMKDGDGSVALWLVQYFAADLTPTQAENIAYRLMDKVEAEVDDSVFEEAEKALAKAKAASRARLAASAK